MITLPAQDFFVPNDNFKQWLESALHIRYNNIFDVGAGRGLMTKFIQDLGMKCTGFDIHLRDDPHTMVQTVSQDIVYSLMRTLPDSPVLMIARPCHNGFAAQYYDRWIHKEGHDFAYYIGLERNLEQDLDGWHYMKVADDVGNDGENVYQVLGREDKVKDFYYLACWAGIYTIKNGQYVSDFPRITKDLDEEVRKSFRGARSTQEAPNPIEILRDRNVDAGWISPAGDTFYVGYTHHSEFINDYLLLGFGNREVDQWLKVWPESQTSPDPQSRFTCSDYTLEPTKAQIRALRRDFDIRYKKPRVKELDIPKRTTY